MDLSQYKMVCGLLMIAVSVLVFIFSIRQSFETHGGAIGMVPVFDGAASPPLVGTLGLFWCGLAKHLGVGAWIYFPTWLIITALAGWSISYAGKLGERQSKGKT